MVPNSTTPAYLEAFSRNKTQDKLTKTGYNIEGSLDLPAISSIKSTNKLEKSGIFYQVYPGHRETTGSRSSVKIK